jgi:Arylsulfotransferase (ASST)
MQFRFDGLVHGSWLFPNGDLIANMDSVGLVRVDACGEIIWQNYAQTHHSVFVDDGGFIWSPKYTKPYEVSQIHRGEFRFDQIGKFDANTGVVEVIDLVELVVEAGVEGIVLPNSPRDHDMMHLNDVETLSMAMADAFPLFEPGDIMLNSRHFNQIWILDGDTHRLKWWQIGPMHGGDHRAAPKQPIRRLAQWRSRKRRKAASVLGLT